MKHLIAFYGRSAFHLSFIEKQLQRHGEQVSKGSGNYLIYLDGRWIHSDSNLNRNTLRLGEIVPFLKQYGSKRPVSDRVWMQIEEEIDRDKYGYKKPLSVGEYLEKVAI